MTNPAHGSSEQPKLRLGDPPSDPSPPVHNEVRFEASNVSVLRIGMVLLGIALVFTGVFIASAWVLKVNQIDSNRAPSAFNYSLPSEAKPAQPRLEPLDYETAIAANVFKDQIAKERVLHSYGVTADEHYVHVPIDIAIRRFLETKPTSNVPTRLPEKAFGLIGGGEANSGRRYAEAPSWLQPNQ